MVVVMVVVTGAAMVVAITGEEDERVIIKGDNQIKLGAHSFDFLGYDIPGGEQTSP